MSHAHLGKRTLSLPRLLCSVDIVVVVTFPPFCSDRVLLFLLTLLTGAMIEKKKKKNFGRAKFQTKAQKSSKFNLFYLVNNCIAKVEVG